jgi:hypothetical protein
MTAKTSRLPVGALTQVNGRTGFGATSAAAHANMLTKAWTPSGHGANPIMDRVRYIGTNSYEYISVRHTVTYDIGPGTMYPLDIRNTAFNVGGIFSLEAREFGFIDLPRRANSGVGNDHEGTEMLTDGNHIVADFTPDIGNNNLVVVFKDKDDWAIPQPDPFPDGGDIRGYGALVGTNSFPVFGFWNEYKTSKTIEVNAGGRIRQIGASVHERISVP